MTTYALEGIAINWSDNADWTGTYNTGYDANVSLDVIANNSGGFTYTLLPEEDDGDVWADFTLTGTYSLVVDGYGIYPDTSNAVENVEATIMQVSWTLNGTNYTTILLNFSIEWGDNAQGYMQGTDYIFVIGGDALPDFSSLAEFEAFADTEDYITAYGPVSGDLAPGEDVLWSDLLGWDSTSQEDDIYGTSGDDVLEGDGGEDELHSSEGDDIYRGGPAFDELHFDQDPSGVYVNLGDNTATDGWGDTDEIYGIEMVRGSMYDDTLIGSNGDDQFRGLAGDDIIKGTKGTDTVRYDKDADYAGGANGVTVDLAKGTATDGFGDTDTLFSIENVKGSDYNDKILGSKQDNNIDGYEGGDTIKGRGGDDKLSGSEGNDKLFGGKGDDTLNGGVGKDRLKGDADNDTLNGGDQKDTLFGGTGDDELNGDNGDDTLDGEAGNDTLTGGNGNDAFVFSGTFGDDVITDFETGGSKEYIDLSGVASITSFSDLISNHVTEVGGDTVIDDGNGNTITLEEILIADLSANDFHF